jgi:MFS family permease
MLRLLLTLTFFQSFATVLLERGLYFYTEDRLGFSDVENLVLALLFGSMYAVGAVTSHRVTRSRGELPTLRAVLLGLLVLHLTMVLRPGPVTIWGGFIGIGLLEGMKWPIIESYISAGATPGRALKVLGRFNVAWSSGVPMALIVAGPLMGSASPRSFIVLAAAIHLLSLAVIGRLPVRPVHLPHDHPERPDAARTRRYRGLLVSARWSLLGGYAMIFLLAPLLPTILTDRLRVSVAWAPGLSAVLDVCRLLAFVLLGTLTWWRGRASALLLGAVGLPLGFLTVLFAESVGQVVVGQVVFGFAAGLIYYAAIYHAMVLANASVEAGGHHEALIGSGFALGPAVGLIGLGLQRWTGGSTAALLLAIGPFLVVLLVLAARPLWSVTRENHPPPPSGEQ